MSVAGHHRIQRPASAPPFFVLSKYLARLHWNLANDVRSHHPHPPGQFGLLYLRSCWPQRAPDPRLTQSGLALVTSRVELPTTLLQILRAARTSDLHRTHSQSTKETLLVTSEHQSECRKERDVRYFQVNCFCPVSFFTSSNRLLVIHFLIIMISRVYHLPRCEVFLRLYHALYLWKQVGMLHFEKIFILILPLAAKGLKLQWRAKNKAF